MGGEQRAGPEPEIRSVSGIESRGALEQRQRYTEVPTVRSEVCLGHRLVGIQGSGLFRLGEQLEGAIQVAVHKMRDRCLADEHEWGSARKLASLSDVGACAIDVLRTLVETGQQFDDAHARAIRIRR